MAKRNALYICMYGKVKIGKESAALANEGLSWRPGSGAIFLSVAIFFFLFFLLPPFFLLFFAGVFFFFFYFLIPEVTRYSVGRRINQKKKKSVAKRRDSVHVKLWKYLTLNLSNVFFFNYKSTIYIFLLMKRNVRISDLCFYRRWWKITARSKSVWLLKTRLLL